MRDKPTLDEHFKGEDEQDRECECCCADGVPLDLYLHADSVRHPDEWKALCDLCSGTYVGTMEDYPRQWSPETREICKTICFVGNEILKELRKGK